MKPAPPQNPVKSQNKVKNIQMILSLNAFSLEM